MKRLLQITYQADKKEVPQNRKVHQIKDPVPNHVRVIQVIKLANRLLNLTAQEAAVIAVRDLLHHVPVRVTAEVVVVVAQKVQDHQGKVGNNY